MTDPVRTPLTGHCPYCRCKAVAAIGDEAPMHGDIVVCDFCGEFALVDFSRSTNHVRYPTTVERWAIHQHAGALRLRQRWYERRLH